MSEKTVLLKSALIDPRPNWAEDWNALIVGLPGAHILQTWEWGQVKARVGWQPLPQVWRDAQGWPQAAGLVLERELHIGGLQIPLRVLYVPKGPLVDWSDTLLRARVLDDLQSLARKRSAIFLKIDPDVILGTGEPGTPDAWENPMGTQVQAELSSRGWQFSSEQIQFRNTVTIELSPSEDELLVGMKPKTRYNLRLAQKKGVLVRPGGISDLPLLYRMYAETSVRDGFVIRDEAYYLNVWESFIHAGMAEPLIAEVEGIPVAAVIVFRFGQKAWYLYGMSRQLHREKMPNVLLQWEALRRAKSAGCRVYDLWGAPDEFTEKDPLWGVYRFKQGLGGQVVRSLGAWDYPVGSSLYRFYTRLLPRWLDWMRHRGRARTQRTVQSV